MNMTMTAVAPLTRILFSAALLVLAMPPYSWGWLAIPAVALLTRTINGVTRARSAAVLAALHSIVFFVVLVRWVVAVTPVALVALVLLMALWGAVLGVLLWRVRGQRWALWLAPACWVVVETLRSWLPWGGFPWGRLAFVGGLGDVTRVALVTSATGLTYLIALLGGLLAHLWMRDRSVRRSIGGVLMTVPLLAVAVWSATPAVVTDQRGNDSDVITQRVLLVQGGVPRAGLMTVEQEFAVFRNHLTATKAAIAARGLTPAQARSVLVVWPESSVGYAVLADATTVQLLQDLVDSTGVSLLSGSVLDDSVRTTGLRNRGMLWQPGRGVTQSYDKQHLVPFGEFVPLRSIARRLTSQVDLVSRDFIGGTRPGIFAIPGSTSIFGDVICFEIAYDANVRELGDVDFVVNQTNNATYLGSGQPMQQFRMAQVRAAELGKYVLVAATSGVSGAIDSHGQVIPHTVVTENITSAQWIDVPILRARPPSVLVGPVLQWVCAAVVAAMLLRAGRRKRKL